MTTTTATTAKNTAQENSQREVSSQNTSLDCRYRQIGISAVAAAARYHGMAKNPAYAPAKTYSYDIGDYAAA